MIPSDGKQIYMVDGRPSSTCITGNVYATDHTLNERTENSIKQYLLLGMTMDKSAGELAPLARSWSNPPELVVEKENIVSEGYSIGERCYNLRCLEPQTEPLEFNIEASEESPVVNLPVVVKNFRNSQVELKLNGEDIEKGKDFRIGHERTEEGVNLIIWLKIESVEPVQITLIPND
jgi:hypothetical protein